MRQFLLDTLRRAAGTTQLTQEMAGISSELAKMRGTSSQLLRLAAHADFPLQHWWERSFWEPTVQHAIRDHVRPGQVAFDVGANAAAFAVMMGRLVGPRGVVCAFEASPRIVGRTQHNIIQSGATNVTLYHRAIWHRTGELVTIAAGSHLNDRVEEGGGEGSVPTLALDDFVAASGLTPSFIKMDIEGAEFDALRGMPRLLAEARPVLVLEQSPEDMRCHALLIEAGYEAVDLSTYRRIHTGADFVNPTGVANVLFAPREAAGASPYFDTRQEVVARLDAARFARGADGGVTMPEPLELPAGRYILFADFASNSSDNEVFAGVEADGEVIFRYHTNTAFMAESYREWVIHLDRPARVAPYLRFLRGADAALEWRGVEVRRLPAFDGVAPPVLF
jgi:FkbM family methyltransferase